jgi:hypothetical protein
MPQMGVDSLKSNLTNPARTYLWEVIVPVPIGNGDSTTYTVRAQSTEIPSRGNGTIKVPYKQTAGIVFAGKLEYDQTWTVTFIEGEDKKVFDAVQSWQQNIVNNVTGIGLGDPLYKTDVYLTTISVGGTAFMKLKLRGAWIQKVDKVSVDYAGGGDGTIRYPVTFAFDSWEEVA